jgi:DNA primase large subunit
MKYETSTLPLTTLAIYPFLPEAALYVKKLNLDLTEITTSPIFRNIIQRSVSDIKNSIKGELRRAPGTDTVECEIQLLSYPVSRILLSCLNNPYLTSRYAVAESKAASENLKQESNSRLKTIAESLNLHPSVRKDLFSLFFTEYVQTVHSIKELKWKLVNQQIQRGWVVLKRDDFLRLLEEVIKKRVLHNMPLSVPEELCESLQFWVQEVRAGLSESAGRIFGVESEAVSRDCFPPCISDALENLRRGANLAHSTRFALTSFLLNVGMSVDEIVELFNVSPDFDVEKTRYQIEHIAGSSGTIYKPPSCATMITFGNCVGRDRLCERVSHPLGYYRKKMWIEAQKQKDGKESQGE